MWCLEGTHEWDDPVAVVLGEDNDTYCLECGLSPGQADAVAKLEGKLKLHKHTGECLEYAARTGQSFCIAECRDSREEIVR